MVKILDGDVVSTVTGIKMIAACKDELSFIGTTMTGWRHRVG